MIVIGENLNSTNKTVKSAIESYDTAFVQELAKKQRDAHVAYIDVNAGMFVNDEPDRIEWLVKTVQEAVSVPLSIDSPNPAAIERALKSLKRDSGKPIINSITNEKERFEAILPLILEYNTGIVALCMDDAGMPESVDDRIAIADRLISNLTSKGVDLSDIYIDPLVRPIGTGTQYGKAVLDTIAKIRSEFPGVHIICGLSNISFGMPARKIINQAFLIAAMTSGLDAAILNPLDKRLMSYIYATEALLGYDEFCLNYIEKFNEGMIEA